MSTHFQRLGAHLIAAILLLSCLGCTRSRVYNMPFDSMVDHLEKKYAFNFAAEQQGIRYFDVGHMQKMMTDGVTDAEGLPIVICLTWALVHADQGIRIKAIRYNRSELLEYSMESREGETICHYLVSSDTPATTRISLKMPFSLTAPFGGDAQKDLNFLQEEIDSKKMWAQFCRTRIGAYGKLAIETIRSIKKVD